MRCGHGQTDSAASGLKRDLAALQRSIGGEVIVPGSAAFARLPKPFNARFADVVPRAVVACASAADVAETILLAGRHRMEIAIRGGGHCFAGRSAGRDLVIDTTPMNAVSVTGSLAVAGAGARLGQVYQALLAAGLTIPAGTCPSVGIAGLTLGGGLGMLGRGYGLTCDHLRAAQVVLADGRIIGCDSQHDAELFWALRGAGAGSFGVVTELVFQPVPAPVVTVFHLAWPFSQATAVTRAWLGWAGTAPGQITASLTLAAGHDPDEPPTAEVFGTTLGHQSDTTRLLEQLTARIPASPGTSVLQQMPYRDALWHWAGRTGEQPDDPRSDPASRSCLYIKSEFFDRPLPPEAVTSLLAHLAADRRTGQARELDFTPWGGAYNQASQTATAFAHRTPLYLVKHTASVPPTAGATETAAAYQWAGQSWRRLHRCGTGQVFPSFPDPDLRNGGHAYYGTNYRRLLTIKARYDPCNRFLNAGCGP
jgi:FAD/FMN-containing dehydrogenase